MPSARELPSIDQHVVRPETREEMVRGRRILAMPALPPHADQHFRLDYILGAHVQPGYVGSTDLLTREAERSNFATDTCIRKRGDDPRTGERYLEELSFEVVNEQSLGDVTERAEDLVTRGVRRVVAIFVKKGEVHEWSRAEGAWTKLDLDSSLRDPTLAAPLPLRDLLVAAEADDAVARALLAKNNPVLVAATAESRQQGRRDGLVEGIEAACDLGGIDLDEERRARLRSLRRGGLEDVARAAPGHAPLALTGDARSASVLPCLLWIRSPRLPTSSSRRGTRARRRPCTCRPPASSRRSTSTSCGPRPARRWSVVVASWRCPRCRPTPISTSGSTTSWAPTSSPATSARRICHARGRALQLRDRHLHPQARRRSAHGERYLEELSFEVVNEQSLGDVTERAEDLVARGVRRVVAIFVKKGEVHEWSRAEGAWTKLDLDSSLRDPTLAAPLPLRDLLVAAEADDAVARALLAKNNPVLVAATAESRRRDLTAGIEAACDLGGIDLDEERRTRLRSLDVEGLETLLGQLRAMRRWP